MKKRPKSFSELSFVSAKAIWPKGRGTEKNLFVGFRAVFPRPAGGKNVLRITGASVYRIFLNGGFLGYGPARGAHGYYRLDEWQINEDMLRDENLLAIEVAGYNVNSYYLLDQPSFIQAEVVSDSVVIASTAGTGVRFEACILKQRIQKVQRYSFQRPFAEYYRLENGCDQWREDSKARFEKAVCSITSEKKLIVRRVAYPDFSLRKPIRAVCRGQIEEIQPCVLHKDRSLTDIGPELKGFAENQLEVNISDQLQKIRSITQSDIEQFASYEGSFELGGNSFQIIDLGTNLSGFIGATICCDSHVRIFITFDEILTENDVDFRRGDCVNAIGYELGAGEYHIESFEPYTLKYLKFIVLGSGCRIGNIYLRQYTNAEVESAKFNCSDERLNKIFDAAKQTYRQNAADILPAV